MTRLYPLGSLCPVILRLGTAVSIFVMPHPSPCGSSPAARLLGTLSFGYFGSFLSCSGSIGAFLSPSSQVSNLSSLLFVLHRDVDPAMYKDESDIFYEDPVAFMDSLSKKRSPTTGTPKESHLVLFEDLITTTPDMRVWLDGQGYHEVNAKRFAEVSVICVIIFATCIFFFSTSLI